MIRARAFPATQIAFKNMETRSKRRRERGVEDDQSTSSKRVKTRSGKRTDEAPDSIPWEVFYMSVAELESQRINCVDSDKVR